jgi:hypothetical protein
MKYTSYIVALELSLFRTAHASQDDEALHESAYDALAQAARPGHRPAMVRKPLIIGLCLPVLATDPVFSRQSHCGRNRCDKPQTRAVRLRGPC